MGNKALTSDQIAYVRSRPKPVLVLATELGVNRGTIYRAINTVYENEKPAPYIPAPDDGAEWRPVAGYESMYEVSDLGRVRNIRTGRFLTRRCTHRGYYEVPLFRKAPQRPQHVKLHRLVAITFIPNPDNLPEVNHKDCDKANNAAANLEWATRAANITHSIIAGRNTGYSNPNKIRKLTEADAAAIRAALTAGEHQCDIAKRFGIYQTTVQMINQNKAHRHGPSAKTHIPVPTVRKVGPRPRVKVQRDRALYADHLAGVELATICEKYSISRSAAYRVINLERDAQSASSSASTNGDQNNDA